jgi:CBS domain-containing protein
MAVAILTLSVTRSLRRQFPNTGSKKEKGEDYHMPHSMPISKLMVPCNEWPQLRAETDVCSAIRLLRIISEEKKLEHGHSTPLIFDENFRLLGFIHLADLLKSIRSSWEKSERACEVEREALPQVQDLVVPFAGTVNVTDNIVTALNIMMEHNVSLVPAFHDGKLEGMVKLSDVFTTVAALLFDEDDPEERHRLFRDFHI